MNVCMLPKSSKRLINSCFLSVHSKARISYPSKSISRLSNFHRNFSNSSEENNSYTNKPLLRLLTKENCMLCEEAKHVLFSAPGKYDERLILKEVDIRAEGNEDLFDLYRYEIPVFFLERRFVSKNFIDLEKLEEELVKIEVDKDGTKQDE